MNKFFNIGLGIVALFFSIAASAQGFSQVSCSSLDRRFAECYVGRPIESVHLARQRSDHRCVLGRTYGISQDRLAIWVTAGCRGLFNVDFLDRRPGRPGRPDRPGRPGRPDRPDYPGYPGPRETSVHCASQGGNYAECFIGDRVMSVFLERQLSGARCYQGTTFGIAPNGRGIFVNRGCEGIFRVTYDRY